MNVTKYPTSRDQADEWARLETHSATMLAADLARELELIARDGMDELVAKVWQLHGAAFTAGRLTGLPD